MRTSGLCTGLVLGNIPKTRPSRSPANLSRLLSLHTGHRPLGRPVCENHSVPGHTDIGLCSQVATWLRETAAGPEGGRQACEQLGSVHFFIICLVPTKCCTAGSEGQKERSDAARIAGDQPQMSGVAGVLEACAWNNKEGVKGQGRGRTKCIPLSVTAPRQWTEMQEGKHCWRAGGWGWRVGVDTASNPQTESPYLWLRVQRLKPLGVPHIPRPRSGIPGLLCAVIHDGFCPSPTGPPVLASRPS